MHRFFPPGIKNFSGASLEKDLRYPEFAATKNPPQNEEGFSGSEDTNY